MMKFVKNQYILSLVLFALTAAAGTLHAGEYDRIFNPLWLGKVPGIETKGWRQSGVVMKTFDMTQRQVADILKGHGFTERNQSDMKKEKKKCKISLWKKNDCQIIVMLLEQEIGKTLFSWGVINDAK